MMLRCPVCDKLHYGKYGICDLCLSGVRSEQNSEHHPDCPRAWHDDAICLCRIIKESHYA